MHRFPSVNKKVFAYRLKKEGGRKFMGSYQNPVSGPDPYRTDRIGDSPKQGDEPPGGPPPKGKEGLAAQILQVLQKALDYFIEKHTGTKSAEIEARKNLTALKKAFEILKNEDRSQDVDFLNELAKIWNQVLETTLHLDAEVSAPFKILAKKILHYPENQTHTLGYYLTEYAGQKWVPFPYMELIQKIHSEHEKNPSSSPLTEWVQLIDEALSLLNKN
jgi:hypothetical protein